LIILLGKLLIAIVTEVKGGQTMCLLSVII